MQDENPFLVLQLWGLQEEGEGTLMELRTSTATLSVKTGCDYLPWSSRSENWGTEIEPLRTTVERLQPWSMSALATSLISLWLSIVSAPGRRGGGVITEPNSWNGLPCIISEPHTWRPTLITLLWPGQVSYPFPLQNNHLRRGRVYCSSQFKVMVHFGGS